MLRRDTDVVYSTHHYISKVLGLDSPTGRRQTQTLVKPSISFSSPKVIAHGLTYYSYRLSVCPSRAAPAPTQMLGRKHPAYSAGVLRSVRAVPAEKITLYLPAFSQRSFANFKLNSGVELP